MAVVSALTGIASASAARQPSSAAPQSCAGAPAGRVAPDAGIGWPDERDLPASPDAGSTNVRPGWRRIRGGEPAVDAVAFVAAASASAVSAAGASGNGASGDAPPRVGAPAGPRAAGPVQRTGTASCSLNHAEATSSKIGVECCSVTRWPGPAGPSRSRHGGPRWPEQIRAGSGAHRALRRVIPLCCLLGCGPVDWPAVQVEPVAAAPDPTLTVSAY